MTKESAPHTSPRSTPDDSFHYRLLEGHNRTDGTYKTGQQLRMEYINLTDRLIYQMTDGLDVLDPETNEVEHRVPDTVIFLDKSARPLAWLTSELWDRLAPDPEHPEDIPKKPDFKFLNIDREQWLNTIDTSGDKVFDINAVDPRIILSLRSIFIEPKDKQAGVTPALKDAPSELDNKTIMIVDEVQSTGRTLRIATEMLRKAFPSASIGGTHWMGSLTTKNGAVGNADIPVWYNSADVTGRGVDNRIGNDETSNSKNITQRLGAYFLSRRFPEPDQKALQLRDEFHHLATHPDVPIRPSMYRDDVVERMEQLNDAPFVDVKHDIEEVLGKQLGR